jgi:hypothetical protein
MDQAIEKVVQEQPNLFDFSNQRGPGGYRILHIEAFKVAILKKLQDKDLCATHDGEEFGVKNPGSPLLGFSEQYDLELAGEPGMFWLRRGEGSYRATCRPAAF